MYNLPIDEVKKLTNTTNKGLSVDEAAERLKQSGKNVIQEGKKLPGFLKFLLQFKNVMNLVLIVAFILEIVIAVVEKNPYEFISAGLIWVVILLNASIGYIQENKAEKAIEALKNESKPYAKVMRGGQTIQVKSEELVVGDVVIIEAGDIVPADLRLIEAASLKIEESALTGESLPSEKNLNVIDVPNLALGDRNNMAFMGGIVAYGRGKGIVVATGMQTQMGLIAGHLNNQQSPTTPLTKRLNKTSQIVAVVVAAVAGFIFISRLITGDHILQSMVITIAIAVCAVPEGLPTAISITMALATQRMSKRKAIIRNLPAVETLGSTEIICSDKTGTITLNKMTVQVLYTFNGKDKNVFEIENNSIELIDDFKQKKNFKVLRDCMLLCNDTQTRYDNGMLYTTGDPTETALVHCANKFGFTKDYADEKFPRVDELPFDSERKTMSTVNKIDEKFLMFSKGAPGNIIEKCNRILDDGKVRDITEKDLEEINKTEKHFASNALRVLGYAYKPIDSEDGKVKLKDESELIFIGLTGMIDPPREEVCESVKTCKKAGIKVIMITGDHSDTAFAIAKKIGIVENEGQVLTGAQLNEISDDALITCIDKYCIFARVNPEHKVRIVNAFKKKDKIVAMTGDGVNDAPSIKAADIGIGMGITGTDVTKKVADVILTDDNFATIVSAVEEGRRTYSNIKKTIIYLLGLSLAELVLLTVIIGLFRLPFFGAILILWINIVTDTLPALALGSLEAEPNLMNQKPNNTRGSLFKGQTGQFLIVYMALTVALVMGVYAISHYMLGYSQEACVTISYLSLAFIEAIQIYNLCRSSGTVFSKFTFKNKIINGAVIISIIIAILPVLIPFTAFQKVLGITSLTSIQWIIAISFGFGIIPLAEIYKLFIRKKEEAKPQKKEQVQKPQEGKKEKEFKLRKKESKKAFIKNKAQNKE